VPAGQQMVFLRHLIETTGVNGGLFEIVFVIVVYEQKINSVAFKSQVNCADRAAAACQGS
jgi:hypothetical protein